jgi:hypothetical protein
LTYESDFPTTVWNTNNASHNVLGIFVMKDFVLAVKLTALLSATATLMDKHAEYLRTECVEAAECQRAALYSRLVLKRDSCEIP